MIELLLILENNTDREHHQFFSSDALEDFIKTINFKDYTHTNILFYVDDKLNYDITKIYCERYLPQDVSR